MISSLKMSALDFLYADASARSERLRLQRAVRTGKHSSTTDAKRLLVDVSVIIRGDSRTGIQRVVRAILSELLKRPPKGYSVCPVFATAQHGYHHVPESFSLGKDSAGIVQGSGKRVRAYEGDIFLALDLASAILPKQQPQLERWKLNGVKLHFFVYDLLPVLHPEWFRMRTTRNFYRWLRALAVIADTAICISNSVKNDLASWLKAKYKISSNSLPINVISMGWDFEASVPSKGMPVDAEDLIRHISEVPSALMVGTLEPRKGHVHVLNAFELLWRNGSLNRLVIVGKLGWKTRLLQARLLRHPELGRRLLWLDDVSDEFLTHIYKSTHGLIMASEGEGFGLPLVEAARHGKPILARSLKVFQELDISCEYFEDNNSLLLSQQLISWFQISEKSKKQIECLWSDTVDALLSKILKVAHLP